MMQDRFSQLAERLSATHLPLYFVNEVNEEESEKLQRALVERKLTVRELREQLIIRFAQENRENRVNSKYALFVQGHKLPLDMSITDLKLEKLGADAIVHFTTYEHKTVLERERLIFTEIGTQSGFVIDRVPALIGRSGQEQNKLDVNLNDHPERRTVSRQHARVKHENGIFYLYKESESGSILEVNGEAVPFGNPHRLEDGAMVQMGKIQFKVSIQYLS